MAVWSVCLLDAQTVGKKVVLWVEQTVSSMVDLSAVWKDYDKAD